ncbi:unnamed protein product [Didymodactylos carnosus]|uniref:EF-hand domain-containing protein n=1 Tax=Didymodactylos carnosus TaxID=1234261 RepID=A0A8S2I4T4_9BILA|nr:unnamed protein product [Didymodactylos carnosus]CAF3717855.1 unnamed protein product [Didymodactylos carnosus]
MALACRNRFASQPGRTVKPQTPADVTRSPVIKKNSEKPLTPTSKDNFSNKPQSNIHARKPDIVTGLASVVLPRPTGEPKASAMGQSPLDSVPTSQSEIFSATSLFEDKSHITNENLKFSDKTPKSISTDANLQSNISNPRLVSSPRVQPTQPTVPFRVPKTVPSDHIQNSSLANSLANTYQHVKSHIVDVSEALTSDPVIRRDVSTMFNEFNIILCGSPRVGKSTLINAICQKQLAKTSAGLDACTKIISRYVLTGSHEIDSEIINYQYNFWDTPGFESWSKKDIRENLEAILKKPKSDILCMIYSASPGSHAKLEQLDWLLHECMEKQIFCALVCTNKWGGQKEQRDAVMHDFQTLLAKYHPETRKENGVIYFGNMGLCTTVNSQKFEDEDAGKSFEQSGVDELIFGIMESLDDEKVIQWCMVVFENKSFWKNAFNFPEKLKASKTGTQLGTSQMKMKLSNKQTNRYRHLRDSLVHEPSIAIVLQQKEMEQHDNLYKEFEPKYYQPDYCIVGDLNLLYTGQKKKRLSLPASASSQTLSTSQSINNNDTETEDKIRRLFYDADVNHDGYVDEHEFLNLMQKLGISEESARCEFDKIIKKDEARLTIDEFYHFLLSRITDKSKLDSNLDNKQNDAHRVEEFKCTLERQISEKLENNEEFSIRMRIILENIDGNKISEYLAQRWINFNNFRRLGKSGSLVLTGE